MTPKERPILFTGAMVRALLDGTKTQTRRAMRKQFPADAVMAEIPATSPEGWVVDGHSGLWWDDAASCIDDAVRCPYGKPGDRLWVKETTVKVEDHGYEGPVFAESDNGRNVIEYGLSPGEDDVTEVDPEEIKLRPSIFMPRAMSRITLEIVSVRVERLQDISEADAIAEGIDADAASATLSSIGMREIEGAVAEYSILWESINGPGSWDANPWVWVVKFKRIEP